MPALRAGLLEGAGEPLEIARIGLLHQPQDVRVGVLGRHLQVPADVVLGQLGQVFRRFLGEVHPDAGGHQHRVDAGHLAALPHQVDQRAVAGVQQLADRGMNARKPLALRLDLGPAAFHLVHVGRRPAQVRDHARERLVLPHLAQLVRAPIPATATG